jgi:two-component system sensor histidine kinase PilS (NtrC family)
VASSADAALPFEEKQRLQRSTIIRVYNYYRILISFLFLFLFVDETFREYVGSVDPRLFQLTLITYLIANVLIGLATLFIRAELLSRTASSFVIVTGDIFALTLMTYASGGVDSGLGNFIIFPVAFAGSLILGRVSAALPAIAIILTMYGEFYLIFIEQTEAYSFFQAGILGAVYFAANILFQTLTRQLRHRDSAVFTLENINQLVIDRMRTGVLVVADDDSIRLTNDAAQQLLRTPNVPGQLTRLPYTLIDRLNDWHRSPFDDSRSFHTHDAGPELLATFSPLSNPNPASETLIFIEDSTGLQRHAQQLKLASLGRLSASIAHEIRNPLGAISHASQLLRESTNQDKGDARLTEIIQDQSVRMNKVIENVLQLSRRKQAEPRPLVAREWIETFLTDFRAGCKGAAVVEVNISPAETMIVADPLHLSQILGNLCQNGLRYSEKNTGETRVLIHGGVDDTTMNPYLEVVDFGTGVDDEQVQHLFEPFHTTETTGTGLGLYLSRELCQANDARLGYSVADTGGSCFRISFLHQASQYEASQPPASKHLEEAPEQADTT